MKHFEGSDARTSLVTVKADIHRTGRGRQNFHLGAYAWTALIVGFVCCFGPASSDVFAEHEVDHRFTVEGFVCGANGQAVSEAEVMAKDTRVSVGKMGYTDSRGRYKVTLHLHNDNQGDPILVTAKEQEQQVKAAFDPNDMKNERKVTVNFGSGCITQDESNPWVYYGVGLGAAAVAAVAGATLIRKRRQPVKRRKGKH